MGSNCRCPRPAVKRVEVSGVNGVAARCLVKQEDVVICRHGVDGEGCLTDTGRAPGDQRGGVGGRIAPQIRHGTVGVDAAELEGGVGQRAGYGYDAAPEAIGHGCHIGRSRPCHLHGGVLRFEWLICYPIRRGDG